MLAAAIRTPPVRAGATVVSLTRAGLTRVAEAAEVARGDLTEEEEAAAAAAVAPVTLTVEAAIVLSIVIPQATVARRDRSMRTSFSTNPCTA